MTHVKLATLLENITTFEVFLGKECGSKYVTFQFVVKYLKNVENFDSDKFEPN